MERDILYVRMFGGFSLEYNGKQITGGAKSSESQFSQVMQILLHCRKDGVTRQKLEELLFEDRDIENVHHATRSVIYNAKKKLEAAGLPAGDLIHQRKGVYYWTDDVPVVEDASELDKAYELAKAEINPDLQLERYLDACYLYTGEFLPVQTSVIWAAQEARRYRAIFFDCVEKAVEMLRARREFMQMEELGKHASRIHPFSDFQTVTMEALVGQDRFDDAKKFYDNTVEMYLQKQGLRPSQQLMELLKRLGSQLEHEYAVLDDVHQKLAEDKGGSGGYMCSYPVFQGVYRMVERMMERGGQSVCLMLCTIVDSKGNPMKDCPSLGTLSQRLGDAIIRSVRHSDAINRYGKGQYLVLLVNTTLENCEIVQRRINDRFLIGRQRTGIRYYVKNVFCEPEKAEALLNGKESDE